MSLEIEGKLIKILPLQTGDGKFGKWLRQDFVIETTDQFPKKVCISAWGDKTDDLRNLMEGDKIKVAFNPESREYNDKWYTDLKAWKITKDGALGGKNADTPPPFTDEDIPMPEEEDLPF